jgi:hypothetical protein
MIFLTYLMALALSSVAGYYSVIGLAAIFPGSFWPIIIMGSVLEASKLVTVSWLYRNWKTAHIGMKAYLTSASVILMLITSMGIFGYLSKAHLEHSSDTAPLAAKVQLIDEKIRVSKENINENRKILKQMDEAVDQIMGRSSDEKGADKAVTVRKSQQKERARITSEISAEQKTIGELSEEKFPLQNELSKAESDFGPIKYVAELIYGSGETDIIDKAVRLVIMLIMVVFDPLAVLLLIAANISMNEIKKPVRNKTWDDFMKGQPTELVVDDEPVGFTAQEVGNILPEAMTSSEQAESYITQEDLNKMMVTVFQELQEKTEKPVDNLAYLHQPFVHFANTKPMPAPSNSVETKEDMVEIPSDNLIVLDEMTGETMPAISKTLEPKYDYDEPFSFKERRMDGGDF